MQPNICGRVYECMSRGVGVLIPSLWVSPFAAFFLSPSFPTSHLRLASLWWSRVSQSSAEGQTDFTVGESCVSLDLPGHSSNWPPPHSFSRTHTHTLTFFLLFFFIWFQSTKAGVDSTKGFMGTARPFFLTPPNHWHSSLLNSRGEKWGETEGEEMGTDVCLIAS